VDLKKTTIFVAGHRGLIGSAVLRRLEAEGCRRVLTRTRAALDLRDARRVDAFFRRHRPKVVVLAAGRVGGIVENAKHPADFIADNLAIELSVLSAARRHGAERVVFFASSCMYPRVCPQPMAEERLETGALEPTSRAYAVAKSAGVELCRAFDAQDGRARFLPLIPNSVYGPGDDFELESAHVLSALVRRMTDARRRGAPSVTLWGSGKPKREFLFCDDLADAVWHLLRKDPKRLSLPMNVGGGEAVSIRELAERVREAVGYQGRILWDRTKPDGAPIKVLDSRRARATGWTPRTRLKEGLKRTTAWYEARS
jgi:GDP-L-fucose synthase